MTSTKARRLWWAAAMALVLAGTAAWLQAAGETTAETADPVTDSATDQESVDLTTPFPQPVQVYVQKTSSFPERGNVLLSVQLDAAAVERLRQEEGGTDFLTIESEAGVVLLRDDGRGGDAAAGDGLYTTLATADEQELAARATEDHEAIADEQAEKDAAGDEGPLAVLRFAGRSIAGSEAPQPFDYQAFASGARVPLDQAVVFTEDPVSGEEAAVELVTSAGRVELATAPATFTCNNLPTPSPGVTSLFQDRVLMIRTVSVVEDPTRTFNPCDATNPGAPNGVWTFKHLMTEMANQPLTGIDPAVLTEEWLELWLSNQTINGDAVGARTQMQAILSQWPRIGGKLDLSRSPLRLLAIAPRVDLRRTTGGGGGYGAARTGKFVDAGELRFVFGFVLPPGWSDGGFLDVQGIANEPGCRALPFTVIFEYGVPACDCPTVRNWAKDWVKLANLVPGTNAYNGRLHRLTQSVVRRNADPLDPNGSALKQLRTNEVALAAPWQLREHQLTQAGFTLLESTTVADTAADGFNNTATFKNWVENRVRPALADCESPIPPVPLFFLGGQFLGGKSQVPEANPALITFFWDAPALAYADPPTNWARHRASRAACSGCHRRETFTDFVHVDPNHPGTQAVLPVPISTFLSGLNYLGDPGQANNAGQPVSNPNNGTPKRHFDDLLRREDDIVKVSKMRCLRAAVVNAALVRATLATRGILPDDPFVGVEPGKAASLAADDVLSNVISEVH